ncbi:MAG: RNA-binding transcriptional accessory protein [Oscillospiraceae bacterium]|nr:RNA-binding transcriptional accessory protein [Oscillospiraceae bacterium]
MDIIKTIAAEMNVEARQIESTVSLLDEGATVPFIARYRKEVTGGLDDTQLRTLFDRLSYLRNLEKRKEEVSSSIEAQEKMTDELRAAIGRAATLVEVEDIYRPYKPKRRTRASVARERGLEPLADALLEQNISMPDPLILAAQFADEEKDVPDAEAALAGAMDIIAEMVSDDADIRGKLRLYLMKNGSLVTRAAKDEDSVYSMYYEYEEGCAGLPGHRILAVNRGEKEGFLKVQLSAKDDWPLSVIRGSIIKNESPAKPYLAAAGQDAYSRLLFPSLENEIRNMLTERAQESAMEVFSKNLHQLLMQPPLKGRVVLGLDPAYRTGCKVAVVDETGKVLETAVIYPTPPQNKIEEAKRTLMRFTEKHGIDVVAIGNGTASRETEMFAADFIAQSGRKISYMVVSEAGASVYSASKLAAEEFPEFDVSLRSAVSIARRMQDPLAELCKIDPKAVGVGQYQHDMPKKQLDQNLGGVVENCVNSVGVDLNTASHSLLSYVSGITAAVAKNIVGFREETGRFTSRSQLLKVPKLGKKAYEQCAGFLRIDNGKSVLDNTAVHPESYDAAKLILAECGFTLADVKSGAIGDIKTRVKKIGAKTLAERAGIGIPTLEDILDELTKPGRDPRDSLPPPLLRTDVLSMSDLKPDMILSGTVRNVIDFGAFVDIGVHQDGLVHISQLADRFIKHPLDAVSVGDIVRVKVLGVDEKKGRISLSMKGLQS